MSILLQSTIHLLRHGVPKKSLCCRYLRSKQGPIKHANENTLKPVQYINTLQEEEKSYLVNNNSFHVACNGGWLMYLQHKLIHFMKWTELRDLKRIALCYCSEYQTVISCSLHL